MRLIWTRRATLDLAEIQSYIARDHPAAAPVSHRASAQRSLASRITRTLADPAASRARASLVVAQTRYVVA
jgi:plasmid stabilization system protein ParE